MIVGSVINVSLPKELNLSTFYKLQSINLNGSNTESVIFPQTGVLKNMILPNTIKTFELYNNPNLESVTFEGYDSIETISSTIIGELGVESNFEKKLQGIDGYIKYQQDKYGIYCRVSLRFHIR